ncbi:MAG TPA: RagB/SusD family nutrient uptake outer membrane protein [Chryseolinea sp.]|nr:RagB/SusD family nutrient uptake outer membrane protein [Chryseolinea sp.]
MKRKLIITAIGIFAVCFSCNEDALDKQNPNEFTPDTFYKTDIQLVGAVNAAYSSLQSLDLVCREYFFVHDLRSDDMGSGGGQLETPRAQLLTGTHDPSNSLLLSVWKGWYRLIHQANQVIEIVPTAPTETTTEAMRSRVVGEAKFLRALAYMDLVVLFGGVPLMETYVKKVGEDKPRASVDQVYSLIISDLEDAIAQLPLKSGYDASNIGRANKQAAQALLARAHMQQGDYNLAKPLLDAIISSGEFSAWKTIPYIENFREEMEFNAESLFEVAFSYDFGGSSWDGSGQGTQTEVTFRGQEYGPNAWRNVIPSVSLLEEYEKVAKGDPKDDPRYTDSFYFIGDKYHNDTKTITDMQGNNPKISWKKYQRIYKAADEEARSGINMRVIRFTEVLLSLAECENALGNDAEAIDLLNEVRSRPGVEMPPYPTANYPVNTPAEVFRAIVHERRVELAGEQIRNRDILRWRSLNKLPSEPISYFTPKHALAPIPQQEIDNNAALSQADQNPEY